MANVLTIAEQREGSLKKVSLEGLAVARQLADASGGTVTAVVVGAGVAGLAQTLGAHGADKVVVVDHPALQLYSNDGYTAAVTQAIQASNPDIVLAGHTALGRDLVPRVAARLDAGLATDCTEISLGADGRMLAMRPVYSGKAYEQIAVTSNPQLATIRPNSFKAREADASRTAQVETLAVTLDAGALASKVVEVRRSAGAKVDLTEANIIVSGGRAMKAAENFKILWDLSDAIGEGCTVGASRAAVDSGFAPHNMQVGQTGKVVNPSLYLAFGISGAIQHLAGMRTSKVIVAVNKDPDAPIFQKADYGIVGDLFQLVPAVTDAVKKLKAEG